MNSGKKPNIKFIDSDLMPDGSVLKTYEIDRPNNALEIIAALKDNMKIYCVAIEETCEMDMKTFGEAAYPVDFFISNYDFLRNYGRELTFDIHGEKNGERLSVGFCEELNKIVLDLGKGCSEEGFKIELTDLMSFDFLDDGTSSD